MFQIENMVPVPKADTGVNRAVQNSIKIVIISVQLILIMGTL